MSINTQIIADNIKKELWSFFSTEAHTDSNILRYINSSIRNICISKNFDFNKYTYSLTTDWITTSYTIPYQVETFFIQAQNLEEIDLYNFENYYRESDKSNIIWIWDTTLITTLTWTYTIYYRWFPDTLVSLSSSITIPDHFYDLIVVWWTYFWFLDVKAYDYANQKKFIFDWMIKSMATRNSNPLPLKTKRLNSSKNNIW